MSEPHELTTGEALVHRIARYRVLRVLGEGGMGVVYSAFDDELARPVALKLVRRGELGADDVRREAQAMARLSHPNVVQVYDVGEHEGALFLAMELIHGQTLDAWLGELGPARVRGLRWREIVEVFVAAGRGLAAAHAAKLVHGDFKPANVFVGAGVVKVGDFGLARARVDADADAHTQGQLGTPAYLAPEQLRGRAGTPISDQFAFCIALHEGLLARRPFAGADMRTLAANVLADRRASVPERSGVPGWLIAVIDRGLAHEPAARWPSMDALLDALLDDPAKRRRRRRALALAGVGLASLATALAMREVQQAEQCEALASAIDEAWNPARARSLAAAFERSGAPESAQTFTRVAAGIDVWTSSWRDTRARVCDEARESPALAQRAASCLEHERWQLDALLDVLAQADRAIVLDAVIAVSELPDLSRCDDPIWLQSDASLAEDSIALADEDSVALRRKLARVLALAQIGRHADALALAETCVAAARERGDALVEADALAKLGGIRWRMADFPGAERALIEGHLLAARLAHDHVAYASARDLAWVVGVRLARVGEGRLWLELARAARVRSGIDPEQDAELHEREAELDVAAGEHGEALVAYRRALALREQRLGGAHPLIAESYILIGRSEAALGRHEAALASLERGRELAIATLGPAHPIVANAESDLGSVLFASGRMADSEAALRRALALREAALGPDDPGLANILVSLAAVLEAEGELLESLLLLERAVAILERQLGRDHPDAIVARSTLAMTKGELGQVDEAIELLRELGTRAEQALGPDDPTLGLVLANLAHYLDARGEHGEAAPLRRRVVAIDEATLAPDDPELANDLVSLARDELAIGEHAAARVALRRALTILEAKPEADAAALERARETLQAIELAQAQATNPLSPR